jgi:hypothetical protein
MNQYQLYNDDEEQLVDEMMSHMSTQRPIDIQDFHDLGTNLKLIIHYEDGSVGLFKPKRYMNIYRKTRTALQCDLQKLSTASQLSSLALAAIIFTIVCKEQICVRL